MPSCAKRMRGPSALPAPTWAPPPQPFAPLGRRQKNVGSFDAASSDQLRPGCPLRQAWGSLDALIGRLRDVRGVQQDDRVQPLRGARRADLPPRSARLAGQGARHPLRKEEEEAQARAAGYRAFDELVCCCRWERQGYSSSCCGVRCSGWRE
jgi:hypothetical protein